MTVGHVVARLADTVLTPSNLLVLLVLAGFVALLRGDLRVGRWVTGIAAVIMLAVAVTPLPALVLRPLEDRFAAPRPAPGRIDGIIVLGGALRTRLSGARGLPALNIHAERMTTFVTLARRYPAARLVFTGGNAALDPANQPTEADVARRLFADLGLDANRIAFEDASRNTYENAVLTKRLIQPGVDETWLLVTSAAHMPRSVGVFRAVGWHVVPWPVAYMTAPSIDTEWSLPDTSASLAMLDLAAHEWAGLVIYRLLGRTQALFPAPE